MFKLAVILALFACAYVTAAALTNEEKDVITTYKELSPEDQRKANEYLESLKKKEQASAPAAELTFTDKLAEIFRENDIKYSKEMLSKIEELIEKNYNKMSENQLVEAIQAGLNNINKKPSNSSDKNWSLIDKIFPNKNNNKQGSSDNKKFGIPKFIDAIKNKIKNCKVFGPLFKWKEELKNDWANLLDD